MSLTATLTFNGTTDAATSAHCLSTGDGTDPTTHGSQELADGSDATYIYAASGRSSEWVAGAFTDLPAVLGINSVTIVRRAAYGTGGTAVHTTRAVVRIGGTNYYSTAENAASPGPADHTYTWTLDPSTGLPWTFAGVNAAQFGMEIASDLTGPNPQMPSGFRITVTVEYTPLPPAVDVTRQVGSEALWMKHCPEAFIEFEGNLDGLNTDLLDHVNIEHLAGPSNATQSGWARKVWQMRDTLKMSETIDLNNMRVVSRLKDMRPFLCCLWDLGWSNVASGSLGNGIARHAAPGAIFTFTRASDHTFTNPVGESETVPADIAAYGPYGLFMLSASGGRAAPRYKCTNNSTARVWPGAFGGFGCEVYLDAVSGAAKQTVAYAYHDASNWHHAYWDGANGRWVFEVRAAGTTYRAIKSASPSANTVYQIGGRWTGVQGELDIDPYTLSVWIDRVKGTDAIAAAAMTEQASAYLDWGSKAAAGTEQLNGQIRKMRVFPYVPTDDEMARQI